MAIIGYYPLSKDLSGFSADFILSVGGGGGSVTYSDPGKTRYTAFYQTSKDLVLNNPFIGLDEWSLAVWFKENGTRQLV